ncbi:MAG: cation transporter [Candidatus Methanoperedenaceae archaeon]|nr:MAG: cation transporter [Candidatus Methanoperedenaceae archaeon]
MSLEFSAMVAGGLGVIFLIVLLGPFLIKKIEHNLEVFLFSMGVLAVTVNSVFLRASSEARSAAEETFPAWNFHLIEKALVDPIEISLAVLFAGLIFHYGRGHISIIMQKILTKISLKIVVFAVIIVLGLLSSVITAIIAALLLVEIISALQLNRKTMVNLTIIACFAIGLGAALTPIGEPLSTIVIKTKMNESFFYLFDLLGIYIIPGVLIFGIIGVFFASRKETKAPVGNIASTDEGHESINDVLIRAGKVYVFVMALVLLGTGFTPFIEWYVIKMSGEALYWVNMVSAILDNATLAAAEVDPSMIVPDLPDPAIKIKSVLMGLLVSGGMLIPGNIPNIIAANKLGITSKEWARLGVPLGLVAMLVYFIILYAPNYI